MRKWIRKVSRIWLVTVIFLGFICTALYARSEQNEQRKIVVFQEGFVNEPGQNALLKNFGAVIIKPLRLINGMAVYLPPQAERALAGRSEILRIDEDIVITALGKLEETAVKGKPRPPQPNQEIPWGIDRIEADLAWNSTLGTEIKVAVLDTGIDLNHPDLINNIKGNVNCINPRKTG
ncbi:MAG: hypothetical protein NC830_00290, partial [Candidatus Omnitrophica bacterium]|nr:hypothetical protein [Candidatus Omnitrophota bacterium]